MALVLYDTWQRALVPFTPSSRTAVGLYCCGPTVYDYAHIGNLRTYLFEDWLRRALEFNGHAVRHVINVTDVGHLTSDADSGEDKMEKGSRRHGRPALEIADYFLAAFRRDWERLNLLPPAVWCRASEHIAEQIAFIGDLAARGYTYRTDDGIYFDSSRIADYGFLARLDRDGLAAGIRVDSGQKRTATDFALWKFSPVGVRRQMEWDSPWGRGFPGWHIECSAMARRYLGDDFDIHCGGEDHIPVHHSNEIAQNQACHGGRGARRWMHGYFLKVRPEQGGEAGKMSKSSGDFLRLDSLLARGFDALAYRYLCLTAHYRHQLEFSWEGLAAAQTALDRLREAAADAPDGGQPDAALMARFALEIDNDLNLPRALALAWEVARGPLPPAERRATLLALDAVLGLGLEHWRREDAPARARELAQSREAARGARQWQEADRLRAAIEEMGWRVDDTPAGPRLMPRRLPG
ncbi:cysteine--tRNA ligase [Paludibacterium yongneupense]|uniref:cysteine--tRNA ligase n=1 Tax=Paludibacterium yongneupense TaxID=400061 RepID=UPI00040BB13D|nr:cysteine--tRNA ligase [Paludibacterium yongneupense]